MKRRSVLAGLGAAITGGAITGTGAFTQVTGERTADIAVKREDQALLRLEELDDVDYPNAGIAKNTGTGKGTLELDLNQVLGSEGIGPNVDAVVTFDDAFRVTNAGSQDVYFWAEFPEAPVYNEMGFYIDDSSKLLDGENEAAKLSPGDGTLVGVKVDTDRIGDTRDDELVEVTIRADATNPITN